MQVEAMGEEAGSCEEAKPQTGVRLASEWAIDELPGSILLPTTVAAVPLGSLLAGMLQGTSEDSSASAAAQGETAERCRPDGKVKVRIYDGTSELHLVEVNHCCIVFGSSLQAAHIMDGTHASIKKQHAALLFDPPNNYLIQPLNGDVKLSGAAEHRAVTSALSREKRVAPRTILETLVVGVGSQPERFTKERCCFTMGKSELVFFVDILPPAENLRRLGVARGLFQALGSREGPRGRERARIETEATAAAAADSSKMASEKARAEEEAEAAAAARIAAREAAIQAAKAAREEAAAKRAALMPQKFGHRASSVTATGDSRKIDRDQEEPRRPETNRVSERIRLRPSRSRSKRRSKGHSPDVWRNDKAKEGAEAPLRLSEERRREASLNRRRQNRQREASSSGSPMRKHRHKQTRQSRSPRSPRKRVQRDRSKEHRGRDKR